MTAGDNIVVNEPKTARHLQFGACKMANVFWKVDTEHVNCINAKRNACAMCAYCRRRRWAHTKPMANLECCSESNCFVVPSPSLARTATSLRFIYTFGRNEFNSLNEWMRKVSRATFVLLLECYDSFPVLTLSNSISFILTFTLLLVCNVCPALASVDSMTPFWVSSLAEIYVRLSTFRQNPTSFTSFPAAIPSTE